MTPSPSRPKGRQQKRWRSKQSHFEWSAPLARKYPSAPSLVLIASIYFLLLDLMDKKRNLLACEKAETLVWPSHWLNHWGHQRLESRPSLRSALSKRLIINSTQHPARMTQISPEYLWPISESGFTENSGLICHHLREIQGFRVQKTGSP